jgi:hypothetical protein
MYRISSSTFGGGFGSCIFVIIASSLLSACCSLMESDAAARSSTLEIAHITFIDKYTVTGPDHPAALPGDFEGDVAARQKKFDDAVAAAKLCHTREQIFENDRTLFMDDVAVLRAQHYFTPAGARNAKKLIQRNYVGLSS